MRSLGHSSHLKAGGSLRNYTPLHTPVVETTQPTTHYTTRIEPNTNGGLLHYTEGITQPTTDPTTDHLLHIIDKLIEAKIDPIAYNSSLERARASGWILSSSEVKQLIGVKPKGDRFTHGCWVFIKSGKIRRENGWRVHKVIEGEGQSSGF